MEQITENKRANKCIIYLLVKAQLMTNKNQITLHSYVDDQDEIGIIPSL